MDGAATPGGQGSPLDAERERLRKQGYTEAEISQIFVAREAGGQQSESPAHGAMTGVASNLAAAGAYAKNFIPGMLADFGTIQDAKAPSATRSHAAASLGFKIMAVLVIGYVLVQEFSQLRSATMRAHADACSARMKMIAETVTPDKWGEANAEYRKECHE